MSDRIDNLFSPDRLRAKWSSDLSDLRGEQSEAEGDPVSSADRSAVRGPISAHWRRCRMALEAEFELDQPTRDLVDTIDRMITEQSSGEDDSAESRAELIQWLDDLEKIMEVQLLPGRFGDQIRSS